MNKNSTEKFISQNTDHYFKKTKKIILDNKDVTVTYAIFMRRPVLFCPRLAIDWLKKVEKALRRITEDSYDECEDCGALIGYKRLVARPEATLCIVCKEKQEQMEKGYIKRRQLREVQLRF